MLFINKETGQLISLRECQMVFLPKSFKENLVTYQTKTIKIPTEYEDGTSQKRILGEDLTDDAGTSGSGSQKRDGGNSGSGTQKGKATKRVQAGRRKFSG